MSDARTLDVTNPASPSAREAILEAAARIRSGGVVVFPTRCLYGLGANALDPEAVGRVFDIKLRPAGQAHPGSGPPDERCGTARPAHPRMRPPDHGEALARRRHPGVRGRPRGLPLAHRRLRQDRHPALRPSRCKSPCGGRRDPITGTSANVSGLPACADISRWILGSRRRWISSWMPGPLQAASVPPWST